MAGETQAELEYGIIKYQNQEYEEAAKWLKRSADKGNALAQFNYGFLLEKGLGVTKQTTEACIYYSKSSEQNNIKARFRQARCHELGLNGAKNLKLASYNYLLAAEAGDLLSRLRLARAFEKGQLGVKDMARAVAWYRLAANMNSRRAKKWLNSEGSKIDAKVQQEVQRLTRGNFRNVFWNDVVGKVRMRFKSKYYNEETRQGVTKLRYRELLAGELYLITLEFIKDRLSKIMFEGGYTKWESEFEKLNMILTREYKAQPKIEEDPQDGILKQANWESSGLYYDTLIELQITGRKELFDLSEVTGIRLIYRPKPRKQPN
tara:strand:- start:252 stop:1208 length:957 start_codon:yes stop_codon:yes gene_type:complete